MEPRPPIRDRRKRVGLTPQAALQATRVEPGQHSLAESGLEAPSERQEDAGARLLPLSVGQGRRAIEDGFPFEEISDIAEVESWRKEVYRPVYHVHKWWAQRLGSVFRAAILGAASPSSVSILDLFYKPVCLRGLTVFDPFMGSGTTVGEAHKLGCTVIGRDINPVAYRAVRTSLGPVERRDLLDHFQGLEMGVGDSLRHLYMSHDNRGVACEVLYYFWVKLVACPKCGRDVDLFSNYMFARHAYEKRHPTVHILCPQCDSVFPGESGAGQVSCPSCRLAFDPNVGPARRTTAVCGGCNHEFSIVKVVRSSKHPPAHRLYAKLVLRNDGAKEYCPATDADRESFASAQARLRDLAPPLPCTNIRDGHNTRQILNYGYKQWCQLFNDRQLLALTMLAKAIHDLPTGPAREAMATLFSGVLEFNNMFASYKGEGTGAVRHMFSHHILKPERTPIEANIWGTSKSSGSFSTLFRSRLLRALEYKEAPFEIAIERTSTHKKGRKVLGISPSMGQPITSEYPRGGLRQGSIYLSCGDSSHTDIPASSVDLVVTDPPFFDNVHYSELADFFFVWQELYFNGRTPRGNSTTRRPEEVQDVDSSSFARKLGDVFRECHRVLKDEGLLVFSYHHSREDGWSAVARAVSESGFSFVQSQPVKSEMSVAAPKTQAKEPIDIDVLLVCRKATADARRRTSDTDALACAAMKAEEKVRRFNQAGRSLSRNDVRVILLSQLLVEVSAGRAAGDMLAGLEAILPQTRDQIEACWSMQTAAIMQSAGPREPEQKVQLRMFGRTSGKP
jgi:putative DNA methylase